MIAQVASLIVRYHAGNPINAECGARDEPGVVYRRAKPAVME